MTKAEAMAAALNEFLDVSWEVEAAAVVSADGLPMASALPPDVEEDRLAAMSASLLTLGERAAEGLDKGQLAQVLVEGEQGYVLLMSAGTDALLVAVMSREAKVGLVLFEMRRAAASIAAVMEGSYRLVPATDQATAELPDEAGGEPVEPAAPAAEAAYSEPGAERAGPAPPAPEVAAPAAERERAVSPASDPSYAESGGAWTDPVEDLRIETPPAETRWSEPIETSQEPASWSPAPAEATAEPPAWSSRPSEVRGGESEVPAWGSPSEPEAPAPPPPAAETDSGEQGTARPQERRGSLWDRATGGEAPDPEPEDAAESEHSARGWRHWRSSRTDDPGERPGSGGSPSGPVSWLDSSDQQDDRENPASAPTWK